LPETVLLAEPLKLDMKRVALPTKIIVIRLTLVIQVILLVSSCVTTAPYYTPSLAASESLEELHLPKMRTGQFSSTIPADEKLVIRTAEFRPPQGAKFSEYLRDAVEAELASARLLDESSSIAVNGILREHSLSDHEAKISAEFFVTMDNTEIYRRDHAADHSWPWNYVGAVAAARAADGYVEALRKLLNGLFVDPDFVRAVEPSAP